MFKHVSHDILNHQELHKDLTAIANALEASKQAKFAKILDDMGLEQDDMGVIVPKGTVK